MSNIIPILKRIWFFIKRSWFILTIAVVLALYFIGYSTHMRSLQISAIVILVMTIVGLILQIILNELRLRSFKTYLESHKRIDDTSIARGLGDDLVTIKRQLSEMMKTEGKCPGMVILLKNTYIYYNANMVESFKKWYTEGDRFNEKVYSALAKQFDLYKNEIQAIHKQLDILLKPK